MVHRHQQRLELAAAPGIAAGGQRAQRVAVIALAARDEMAALRLADLDEVLPRHLHRGLDGLRAAGDEIDIIEPLRRQPDQPLSQFLGDIGGEEGGVGVGDAVDLRAHRGHDLGMAVTEAGDGGATAGVKVTLAAAIDHGDADGAGDHRRWPAQVAVNDVVHGVLWLPRLPRGTASAASVYSCHSTW
jgi:hypothetical protein